MKRLLLWVVLVSGPLFLKAQVNANGVIDMGRNALYYEDYVLAIQYFNQVIEAKPYLYEPYYYRAIAKYYLGDYHGSSADCSLSIDRDPFIDNCFRLRAISYVMMGDYEKAADDYSRLISRHNDDSDIWYNLVLCQSQLKRFEAADSLLDSMIVKWPKHARCYMLKAQVALEQKDTVSAGNLIDQTLQIDSFEVDALSGKAMLLMHADSFSLAEQYYERAIVQSPRKAGFFLGRALARYQQKKLRGAMEDYNVALDLEPDNYPGHYNRGLLRMQVGENNLAIEDFNFVLKKDPHDRLALYNRATLLEKTGDYRAAAEDYTSVLDDYPDFLAGYVARGRCYRRIGETSKAVKDERKVLEAQLDEMYGSPKKSKRTVRKQKEQKIEEYQNLVVEDESDELAKFYATDYRGRVQNRDVSATPAPLYVLTFNVQPDDVIRRKDYALFVEKLNEKKIFTRELHISSRALALEESDIASLDSNNVKITNQIGTSCATAEQLFALAMISYSKHDDVSALASLDQALRQDSTFEAALFLRSLAIVSTASQIVEAAPKPVGNKEDMPGASQASLLGSQLASAVVDLTRAIAIDSQCPYLYYNRGCIYQRMHQAGKAVEDYSRAIALDADLSEAYFNRGLAYVDMGDYSRAFADLGKAGELGLYSAYSLIKHYRKLQNKSKDGK